MVLAHIYEDKTKLSSYLDLKLNMLEVVVLNIILQRRKLKVYGTPKAMEELMIMHSLLNFLRKNIWIAIFLGQMMD